MTREEKIAVLIERSKLEAGVRAPKVSTLSRREKIALLRKENDLFPTESEMTEDQLLDRYDNNSDDLIPDDFLNDRGDTPLKTKQPYNYNALNSIKNLPGTLGEAVWDMTYPVRHPVKTYRGIKDLGKGLYQGAMPGYHQDEEIIDRMGEAVSDRYGNPENALKTLENDPGGALFDALAVASLGGAAVAKVPGKVGRLADKVSNAANKYDPINMAISSAYNVPKKYLAGKKDPFDQMLVATKFGTSLDIKGGFGARKRLAETMLEYGYELNDVGIKKLIADMNEVGVKMDDILKTDPRAITNTIPRSSIERHIPELMRSKASVRRNIDPAKNAAIIQREIEGFRQAGRDTGNTPLTLAEVNALKKDFYESSNYGAGKSKKKTLKAQTNRAMGLGAKEIVSEGIPEIAQYNEKWGRLAELKEPLMRSSGRVGNRDPGGLLPLVKGLGTGMVAGTLDPTLAIPAAITAYRYGQKSLPQNMARSAQEIYNLQRKSYADMYDTNGALPNLLRMTRAGGQFAEDQLDDEWLKGLIGN